MDANWTQFIIFFIGVFGMFLWNRSESRADIREVNSILKAIQEEIKDFHGRLCTIEEKNKGK